MIIEYHRPEDMEQALSLLARRDPITLPLGGGTVLNRKLRGTDAGFAVVDLQRLSLNTITREGQLLHIGATTTLQQLLENEDIPEALRESLRIEAALNMRQMATVAGTLVSCDGRSPFVTALLALDPRIVWASQSGNGQTETPLGDYLPLRSKNLLEPGEKRLIAGIRFALNVQLRFEGVGRTPLDQPVVCVAVGMWPSGRTRVTLGGYGVAPILAMDGPEPGGAGMAAKNAYRYAVDAWASAEYRAETAGILASRLVREA